MAERGAHNSEVAGSTPVSGIHSSHRIGAFRHLSNLVSGVAQTVSAQRVRFGTSEVVGSIPTTGLLSSWTLNAAFTGVAQWKRAVNTVLYLYTHPGTS